MLPLRRLAGAQHPEDSPMQGRSAGPNLPAGGSAAGTRTARRETPVGPFDDARGRSGHAAGLAAGGELVTGVLRRRVVIGPLTRELRQLTLDLAPDAADRDAED